MQKRILCVLLAALVVLSLIPAFALPSRAASNMKTSEQCIDILKAMEGFIQYPVFDHGQYSIGYGSGCNPEDYPNGITKEEADALLREYLADMEKALNDFANRHGFVFSRNQFDALMLFTYNCGYGWVSGDGEFRQAVLENAVGNDFIFEITQWSAASGQLHMGLVTRRLIEADMYLNGSYANTKPASYSYVLYDNNGGESKVRVQGYDWLLSGCVRSVPTREGYRFLGWYTAAEGGSWITELTAQNAGQTLYAHWQSEGATAFTAAAASYQVPSGSLVSRDYYNAPGGTVAGTLNADAAAVIQADFVDNKGMKWGRMPNGCWVKLGDPRIGTFVDTKEPETGVKVKITGDYVNVRSGPGTHYSVVSAVLQNDVITITQTVDVDGTLWGKFRGGWLCLEFTDYSGGLTPGQPDPNIPDLPSGSERPIATGVVNVDVLSIRATAGSNGYVTGSYRLGDRVEILEKTTVAGADWGRTDRGWICLSFVKLDDSAQPTEPENTEPETTEPPENEDELFQPVSPKGTPAVVISKTGLNIRSGAGTGYPRVGSYASGSRIRILEQKNVSGVAWGRTDKGWVCMQYVRLEENRAEETGIQGRVISSTGLNIRSGPGVVHPPVGSYAAGETILILEQTVASGRKWGRTDKGWVCMDYVRLEDSTADSGSGETQAPTVPETTAPETTPPQVTEPEQKPAQVTGTVTASALNVRASAGTGAKVVGSYRRGDKVVILEQTTVSGTHWGRTDKGWISLAYVKLSSPEAGQDAARTGMITASALCIRKGPGTGNAIVGTYQRGEIVTILETVRNGVTLWGRTDKGWICMDYVK